MNERLAEPLQRPFALFHIHFVTLAPSLLLTLTCLSAFLLNSQFSLSLPIAIAQSKDLTQLTAATHSQHKMSSTSQGTTRDMLEVM